jgi:hypothetical protein
VLVVGVNGDRQVIPPGRVSAVDAVAEHRHRVRLGARRVVCPR